MATKDGRTQIWYADGNGNVEGYTETVGNIAETIIGAYNEHFGTDIQLWTPETKTLQVGGTVPNWNAYEKILIQLEDGFYKYDLTNGHGGAFACMEVNHGNVGVYASSLESGNNINVYVGNGTFNSAGGGGTLLADISQICSKYPNFVSVSKLVKDNSNLENWDDYSLLS